MGETKRAYTAWQIQNEKREPKQLELFPPEAYQAKREEVKRG